MSLPTHLHMSLTKHELAYTFTHELIYTSTHALTYTQAYLHLGLPAHELYQHVFLLLSPFANSLQ
jgi:hypothetical protein